MTAAQLDRFLREAKASKPDLYLMFFLMARTGLRLGEARGLQWGDLDLTTRTMRVSRTYGRGDDGVGPPKSALARNVDVSFELRDQLLAERRDSKVRALLKGWQPEPAWVFRRDDGAVHQESWSARPSKRPDGPGWRAIGRRAVSATRSPSCSFSAGHRCRTSRPSSDIRQSRSPSTSTADGCRPAIRRSSMRPTGPIAAR
jgi:integrase